MPDTQPVVIMTVGLPASGKSTWAKEHIKTAPGKWIRVNKDDLRIELHGGAQSRGKEKQVLRVRDERILAAVDKGVNVVVDDTNINPIHEEQIRKITAGKATVEIKSFMDVPVSTCLERNRLRTGTARVPDIAIRSMANQWKKLHGNLPTTPASAVTASSAVPAPTIDPKLPWCILVDLDGTLALVGDRSPYDTARAYKDKVNLPVQKIVEWTFTDNEDLKPTILLVTGREDKFEDVTREWLKKNGIPFMKLYMRPAGDRRKDTIVKREIYEQHIKGKYNVLFVLEDRAKVVKMYREELGLTVLQVAEGNY